MLLLSLITHKENKSISRRILACGKCCQDNLAQTCWRRGWLGNPLREGVRSESFSVAQSGRCLGGKVANDTEILRQGRAQLEQKAGQ